MRIRTLDGRLADPGLVGLFFSVDDCNGDPVVGLTDRDFDITESNMPLPMEAARQVGSDDGLQIFVTLLLDVSSSTVDELEVLVAAARTFVEDLQVTRELPVQVAIELFAGGDDSDPQQIKHSETWQSHFLDTDTLLSRLDLMEEYQPPSADRNNLHGAITSSLQKLSGAAAAFRQRNRGGAFTTVLHPLHC